MPGETIELAKNWNAGKMQFPAVFQQKMDGMPVRFIRTSTGINAVSRQGEPVTSVQHICDQLYSLIEGECVVLEVLVPGLPFKTSTGLIRQSKKQVPEAVGYLFDAVIKNEITYLGRLQKASITVLGDCIKPMPHQKIVYSAAAAQLAMEALQLAVPDCEGACLHFIDKLFEPGKRYWTFQRMKPEPTIDLELHSYEEAIDQYGNPKGMVGRINVKYRGKIIGIGPGKMTHDERIYEWEVGGRIDGKPRIIEVKYKPDDTYDALREARFFRFRPDKEIADA